MKQNIFILSLLFGAAILFAQVKIYDSYFYETDSSKTNNYNKIK